jgi:transcriptional regulator with XRE-family HTH domain
MDDQVLNHTDVFQRDIVIDPAPPASEVSEFARLLERLRHERGWSKADLAKRSALDPSSITRFEQGNRNPDRETVLQLAEAMALPMVERDRLLAASGYRSEIWDEPLLVELSHILADDDIPADAREKVRTVLQMAIAYGRIQRFEAQ